MASLWKHRKSQYFTACYTDHTGKQRKRSTKKTNRDDAMAVALEYERSEQHARDGILTEAQCRKVLSEILEKTTGEALRQPSVREYLKEWIDSKEAARSKQTAIRYSNTVDLFLEFLGERADRPLCILTPALLQAFLDGRLKDGCSTKTVTVDRKTLSGALNRARKQGLITTNPVEAVELPSVDSSERETFSPSQVKALLTEAKGDWKTAILIGYYTGARLQDCANMQWSNVNFTEGVIRYEPRKTSGTTSKKKVVIVPLHGDLEGHLQEIASNDKPEVYLCPDLAERDSGGAHGLSARFKDLMKNAGVDTQTAKGKGKRMFSKLSFHSLRHSFNSALANAGVSQELRMKLTGHSTIDVNSKYTHHEIKPLKEAVYKLPSFKS